MPDICSCFAGILCGGSIVGIVDQLRSRRQKNGAAAGKAGSNGRLPSPNSPIWGSPPTHLRRASPTARNGSRGVQQISPEVALTKEPADFGRVPGVAGEMDGAAFVEILRKLMGQSKFLQNNPRLGVVPEEKRAAAIVMDELRGYSSQAGGPLVIEELEYKPGRTNLKVTYPGSTNETISFVGSHFDVVPADPEQWGVDPFSLTVKGDKLYGRGTTDCLGHVALITQFLAQLGKHRPQLKRTIVVLFIAGEEGGEKEVGIDCVVNAGKLEEAKRGPVYWVDTADSQPCCGSNGMLGWSLKCTGRLFHSGFPHKGINSIELASEATSFLQGRFYDDFPPHPSEDAYRFATGSHLKPTQIECAKGSVNQICPECTVHGDIRLSPFYEVEDVMNAVEQYVQEMNDYLDDLPTRGPYSKFILSDDIAVNSNELRRGRIELKWSGDLDLFKLYAGIAVSLDSPGHKALVQACREAYSSVAPFSISGSLPLVNMMQKAGFDIQLCGFGLMSVYHGVDEYCTLSGMQKAYEVLVRVVALLEASTQ